MWKPSARRKKSIKKRVKHVVSKKRHDTPWNRLNSFKWELNIGKTRPDVWKQELRSSKWKYKIKRLCCTSEKRHLGRRKNRCVVLSRHNSQLEIDHFVVFIHQIKMCHDTIQKKEVEAENVEAEAKNGMLMCRDEKPKPRHGRKRHNPRQWK